MTSALGQLSLSPAAVVGVYEISMPEGNELLARWGHYLGPCNRPFGQQAFVLSLGAEPISVAISASAVSSHISVPHVEVEGDETTVWTEVIRRDQIVELARLCSSEPWATRVMLRLWREACVPAWPHWRARAAISYSQNEQHEGRIYRFDGWEKITDRAGSSGGGGQWTAATKGKASAGIKTLWLWRFPEPE